jgi:large subunit ribosomal protein L25
LYGHGIDPVPLVLDPEALEGLLRASDAGTNTLIDLEGASQVAGKTVLVKDMQRHPVRGSLMHADLYAINVSERIQVAVPIHLIGTPEGVTMGDSLHVSDLALPDGVELRTDAGQSVASVVAPKVEEEPEVAEVAEGDEAAAAAAAEGGEAPEAGDEAKSDD